MSKRFLANVIQEQSGLTGAASYALASSLLTAIKAEIIGSGHFTVPEFGSFMVREIPKRNRVNPRTGEKIVTKPSATVRFKASPVLRVEALASLKKKTRRRVV